MLRRWWLADETLAHGVLNAVVYRSVHNLVERARVGVARPNLSISLEVHLKSLPYVVPSKESSDVFLHIIAP